MITDSNGYWSVGGFKNGTYTLTYEKDGFTLEMPSVEVIVNGSDVAVDDVRANELGDGGGNLTDTLTFVTIPDVADPSSSYEMTSGFSITFSSFEISTTEVTNEHYVQYLTEALESGDITATSSSVTGVSGDWGGEEYLDLDSSDCQISYSGGLFTVDSGMEKRPVVEVTWFGAKAFAVYYGLDLPTETEWQYAASGGMNYEYGTDDGTIDSSKANYAGNIDRSTDVGSYPKNPFGLYDMAGNVWELCHDWYGAYPGGAENNYTGVIPACEHIGRGGNWESASPYCLVAYRSTYVPKESNGGIGFRVVRRSSSQHY